MTVFFFGLVVVVAGAFAFLNGFRDAFHLGGAGGPDPGPDPHRGGAARSPVQLHRRRLSAALASRSARPGSSFRPGTERPDHHRAGLPAPSSGASTLVARHSLLLHACAGGRTGRRRPASVAVGGTAVTGVDESLLFQVVLPLLLSPAIAFVGAYLLVLPVTWAARYTPPERCQQPVPPGPDDRRRRRRVRPRPAGRPADRRGADPCPARLGALRRRLASRSGWRCSPRP